MRRRTGLALHRLRDVFGVGLLALTSLACSESIDTALEGHACTAQGECLRGYTCSEDRVCVRARPTSRKDAGGEKDAAGPSLEVDASIVTGGTTSCERGTRCGDACIDTTEHPQHCGACDQVCPAVEHGSAVCRDSRCQIVCREGWNDCAGSCVHFASLNNCGACGRRCPPPASGGEATCSEGTCGVRCDATLDACGGACVNTQTDPMHCGACDMACPPTQQCAQGVCVPTCPEGTQDCSRSCTDTQSDPLNCGMCGQACPTAAQAVATCAAASCGARCIEGFTDCGGSCVDTQSDPAHCGSCTNACPIPMQGSAGCAAAQCTASCPEGHVLCDDRCISTTIVQSARLVGAEQRTPCAAYAALRTLVLRRNCMGDGRQVCSDLCFNVTADPQHCGSCDNACSAGQACYRGFCVSPR